MIVAGTEPTMQTDKAGAYGLYAATPPHDPYEHPLICWGSVFAGSLIAIATGVALALLGAAIGASAISPFASTRDQAPTWTIAGGLWVAFSNLLAIQLGAFVAARAATYPDHHHGALQGLVVWAFTFVVAFAVLGAGVGTMVGARGGLGLQSLADTAQTVTGQPSGAPTQLSPAEADAAKKAAALTAWWAFATVVLGAIGAVAGGYLGSQHPKWHRKAVRAAADRVGA